MPRWRQPNAPCRIIVASWPTSPSAALRTWYGHRVERWEEFSRRYGKELAANRVACEPLLAASRRGSITLLYSARDVEHNSALVLRDFLRRQR